MISIVSKFIFRILQGKIFAAQDFKERARYLADNYDIDVGVARKLWAFGPEGRGSNLLFDASRGQTNLGDIKDTILAGFEWATSEVRINSVFFDLAPIL